MRIENGTETETDTKPFAADHLQQDSNDFSSTSTAQSNTITAELLHDRHESQMDHKCGICSQEFRTVKELDEHQRQGRDDLIGSIFEDCKPMPLEFAELQYDGDQVRGDIVGLNIIGVQSASSKSVANQEKSDGKTSKRLYPCDKCDRVYKGSSGLYLHQNVHTGARKFKCEPCNKS